MRLLKLIADGVLYAQQNDLNRVHFNYTEAGWIWSAKPLSEDDADVHVCFTINKDENWQIPQSVLHLNFLGVPCHQLLLDAIVYANKYNSDRIFFFLIDDLFWDWTLDSRGIAGREPVFILSREKDWNLPTVKEDTIKHFDDDDSD